MTTEPEWVHFTQAADFHPSGAGELDRLGTPLICQALAHVREIDRNPLKETPMSHRLKPPKHPVTKHPHVDNALRNAWRDYRDYLRGLPWLPGGHTQPRKTKKKFLRGFYKAGFIYHEPAYYIDQLGKEVSQ